VLQKDLYQREGEKERHPPAFLRHMGSGLHAETGCRKGRLMLGKYFSDQRPHFEMFSYISSNFLTKSSEIFPKTPKNLIHHLPTSVFLFKPEFTLKKKMGPAGDNCIAYLEAKETIGDGGGRKYANSQFSNQNTQDAIIRVSALQNSVRGPRCQH
jgi:hypothetical protein